MAPRPTEPPSLSPCEPGTGGTDCGCLRQQMGLNKCLCARKALESLSWVMMISAICKSLWHSKAGRNFPGKSHKEPPHSVAKGAAGFIGGRKGGSLPSSVEKQGSSRVSSCLLPAHGVCLHPPPPPPPPPAAPVHPSTPSWECSRLGELLQNPGQHTQREMEGLKFDNC